MRPIVTVSLFLDSLGRDLAPGAREMLSRHFVDGRPHSQNIARMVKVLADPGQGSRFLTPGVAFTREGETLLHATLRRMPLKGSDAADTLATAWHTELWSVRDPGRLAAAVVERLDKPANHELLDPAIVAAAERPAPERTERKVSPNLIDRVNVL